MKPQPQDWPPPLPSYPPLPGEAPTASSQETPAAGTSPHVYLGVGSRPLPEYELTAKLGQGGFGEVWRAKGPGGFDVALKFLRLGDASGATELKALQTIKGVRHPNLLSVFGVWEKDSHLIVAMELADRSLLDRLKEAVREGKPGIPPQELLDYMMDAARGLDFLNEKGIQHRDVKPHNLFLYGRGVKVADFGLAKVLGGLMATASAKMTPAYAAPEFLNGQASRWSDQYSLAVTYCQLRANQLPYQGTTLEILSGHMVRKPDLSMLPIDEQPLVGRALAKDPAQRWPTCRTFVEGLMSVQGVNLPVSPPGVPILPPAIPKEKARSKTVAVPYPPPSTPIRPSAERDNIPGRKKPSGIVPTVLPRPPAPPSVLPLEPARTFPLIAVVLLGLLFITGLGAGIVAWWVLSQPASVVQNSNKETTPKDALTTEPKPSRTGEKETTRTVPKGPDTTGTVEKPLVPPALLLNHIPPLKIKPGETLTLTVRLSRERCQGSVRVQFRGLPPGITAAPVWLVENADIVEATFHATTAAPVGVSYVDVVASLDKTEGSTRLRLEVEPPPKVTRQPWPVEKLLPNNTDAVLHLDCRAFLQADLVNRHLRGPLLKMLRTDPLDKVMRAIAFDPLQDLDSLTLALSDLKSTTSSTGQDVKGLFLCKGKFTREKIKASLEAATPEAQRSQRGEFTVFEVKGTNGTTEMFCVLLDETSFVAGTHKELVVEVCDRVSADRSPLLKLRLERALSQVRRSQTFWMAMAFPDWMRDQIRTGGATVEPFAKISELTLHLSVAGSIQLEIEGFVDDATVVSPLKAAMDQLKPLIAAVPAQLPDKQLAEELGRLFSDMTITSRTRSVTIRLDCPAGLAEKLIDLTKKNAAK